MNDTFTYYLILRSNTLDIQLNPGSVYFSGRSPENNILLADPMVSPKHARIEFAEGSFKVKELTGSGKRTLIPESSVSFEKDLKEIIQNMEKSLIRRSVRYT